MDLRRSIHLHSRPKPPARAEISGQLTGRRPSAPVSIRPQINDGPGLSLREPIHQDRQLGHMMIKHPDGRGLLGPGPRLQRELRLDLIAGGRRKIRICWQVVSACEVTRVGRVLGSADV